MQQTPKTSTVSSTSLTRCGVWCVGNPPPGPAGGSIPRFSPLARRAPGDAAAWPIWPSRRPPAHRPWSCLTVASAQASRCRRRRSWLSLVCAVHRSFRQGKGRVAAGVEDDLAHLRERARREPGTGALEGSGVHCAQSRVAGAATPRACLDSLERARGTSRDNERQGSVRCAWARGSPIPRLPPRLFRSSLGTT